SNDCLNRFTDSFIQSLVNLRVSVCLEQIRILLILFTNSHNTTLNNYEKAEKY
ncbi:hypothetical protein WUBG_10345, partial [Wuchereria bancrofti]